MRICVVEETYTPRHWSETYSLTIEKLTENRGTYNYVHSKKGFGSKDDFVEAYYTPPVGNNTTLIRVNPYNMEIYLSERHLIKFIYDKTPNKITDMHLPAVAGQWVGTSKASFHLKYMNVYIDSILHIIHVHLPKTVYSYMECDGMRFDLFKGDYWDFDDYEDKSEEDVYDEDEGTEEDQD